MTDRNGRRRLVALAVCVGVSASVCAGCSGAQPAVVPTIASIMPSDPSTSVSNGIESLPAPKLLAVVGDAVQEARSVHVVGTYSPPLPEAADGSVADPATEADAESGRRIVSIDVRGSSATCIGTIMVDGGGSDPAQSEWRRMGQEVFVRGNGAFAALIGQEAIGVGFVRFDVDDERIAPWMSLLDPLGAIAGFLEPAGAGEFELGARSDERDARSLQLEMSAEGVLAGTVQVATVGPPLPLAMAITDRTGRGVFAFSSWGEGAVPERPEYVDAAPVGG